MAKFRVKIKSFIGNAIQEEGAIVEYDGIPSDNLEPLDPPAQKAAEQSGQADMESLARQRAAAAGAEPDAVDTAAAASAASEAAAKVLAQSGTAAGLV